MVSIRYHIVTLVAVFLALGIGVAMGSTVIDKALVDRLEGNVNDLRRGLDDARRQSDELKRQLDGVHKVDERLDEQGPGALLAGRLDGVPVLVVAVEGIDDGAVGSLRRTVTAAGGRYQGTVWLRSRLALTDTDTDAAVALAGVVGEGATDADSVRQRLADRLATGIATAATRARTSRAPDGSILTTTTSAARRGSGVAGVDTSAGGDLQDLLDELSDAGFVRQADRPDADQRDLAGVRVVVVSGAGATVPDGSFLQPLFTAVSSRPIAAVVAAEVSASAPAEGGTPAGAAPAARGVFVGPVRADRQLHDRISTVDDLEVFAGRAATVLAIGDLDRGVVGHYGIGDGAEALLPAG